MQTCGWVDRLMLTAPLGTTFTLRRSKRQQNNHGVDDQDVHRGRFSTGPTEEHLILGFGL